MALICFCNQTQQIYKNLKNILFIVSDQDVRCLTHFQFSDKNKGITDFPSMERRFSRKYNIFYEVFFILYTEYSHTQLIFHWFLPGEEAQS